MTSRPSMRSARPKGDGRKQNRHRNTVSSSPRRAPTDRGKGGVREMNSALFHFPNLKEPSLCCERSELMVITHRRLNRWRYSNTIIAALERKSCKLYVFQMKRNLESSRSQDYTIGFISDRVKFSCMLFYSISRQLWTIIYRYK
jgi:hypothetical protein